MLNLFDEENPESGFRLTVLELFNWGTFDRKIWQLTPDGKNSLLTGGNGSGKTTVVDAIVTLLVPPVRRHYNQSSGSNLKRDRTEGSYVLGAYKTIQREGELTPRTQYLRDKDDLSILVGVFTNADLKETLTLAQVRWYANNTLKKLYLVAPVALNIREHFYPIRQDGEWKTRLKEQCRAEIFPSFPPYSHRFCKTFGIKSEKALSLFSQTVGIKVIGNLNEFIRNHMLSESRMEDAFRRLKENYDNLLSAHTAIEKARTQLDLLGPVMAGGERFESLDQKILELVTAQKAVTPFFAHQGVRLLTEAIAGDENTQKRLAEQLDTGLKHLEDLNRKRDDLNVAISRDNVSEELRNIDRDITEATRRRDACKARMAAYNRLARQLDLPEDPEDVVFSETRTAIASRREALAQERSGLNQERRRYDTELAGLQKELEELVEELLSLRRRKGNIPKKHLAVRKRIIDHLGLKESDLPFVGELVRIKAAESDWEAAIERVLHGFGLHLLVPQAYSGRINEFINKTDLHGHISFYSVPENRRPDLDLMTPGTPSGLAGKLAVKDDTPFYEWLKAVIRKQFRHVCTDALQDLARLDHALTGAGLFKELNRYEKDDRDLRRGRESYVFGWDNREKIRFMERRARGVDENVRNIRQRIDGIQRRIDQIEKSREELLQLAGFEVFDNVNWREPAGRIEILKTRKQELLESSDRLRSLEAQLDQVKRQIGEEAARNDRLKRGQWKAEENLKKFRADIEENRRILSGLDPSVPAKSQEILAPWLEKEKARLQLDTLLKIRERVTGRIEKELKKASAQVHKAEQELMKAMGAYKFADEVILQKYPDWISETTNLVQGTAYLKEYRAIHDRIETEDLPRYRDKFKKFLNEQVVLDIANFKTTLEHAVDDIRQNIRDINLSLKTIDYNAQPATYIRLIERNEKDVRIRNFKQKLREAMPDAAKLIRGDEMELEYSFTRIKALIEEMSENIDWRRYVTDVRNWLRFAAEERYRADDLQKQYYEDSQSLSGGEKAKLAYTILASAIAYQFGIEQKKFRLKSFRFVVVDEAFSKVDPENSIYAMELFRKLNLQLMLVTPLDKISLAEKYIHSVHYVENKHQRDSAVYDLTIEEYQAKKAAFRDDHTTGNSQKVAADLSNPVS
jgi:uncharacterized protein YPO0396